MFKKNRHGIQIKTPEQLEKMRGAGLVVGRTLDLLKRSVEPGMTPLDLDVIAEKAIRDEGAIPSFKGYQGFPATICASVNNEVVHGIPTNARKLCARATSSRSTAAPSSTAGTATPRSPSRWARWTRS